MRAALALALAGCFTSSAPPAPVGHSTPPPVVTTSCAIEPARTAVDLRLVKWLGRIGDRSWVIAERKRESVLLGYDGALREIALGEGHPYATHVDGTQLWLAMPKGQRMELRRVDLATGKRTGPGRPEENVTPGGAIATSYVRGIAVGRTRALADVSGPNLQLQLFDLASGAKVGAQVELRSTELSPANLMCTGDRCTALGVEGDGPTRRIFVERFAPDGTTQHEQLAGDHIASYKLVVLGARRFAMWTAFDVKGAVSVRELDATGHPIGERVKLATEAGTDFEVLPDPQLPRLAFQRREGWWLAAFDPAAVRLGAALASGLPRESYFFLGATVPDGALLVGFTSNVDYRGGFHTWSGAVFGAWAPTGSAADPPVTLSTQSGEGRGGVAGFPLVSPGHAAVIVLPQGPESGTGGELIALRAPCR